MVSRNEFVTRPETVQAMQWDGTLDGVEKIRNFIFSVTGLVVETTFLSTCVPGKNARTTLSVNVNELRMDVRLDPTDTLVIRSAYDQWSARVLDPEEFDKTYQRPPSR